MFKAIAFIICVAATTAFSLPENAQYTGGGEWKEPSGKVGTWKETVTFSKSEDGTIAQTSKLEVLSGEAVIHSESASTVIVIKEAGFFEVKSGDKKMGEGYCFDHVCHLQFTNDKESGEETMLIGKNGIAKMGSVWGETKEGKWSTAYRGRLKLVKP